ncbi:50S ribosomal protein L22 [Abeliophyllum distichum]|uniref:50S ribosomal protein L22 n=1 Tax=Abeliophyllum distichum TaxID=126358 RepID=A0ABD1ULK5_9LAMI
MDDKIYGCSYELTLTILELMPYRACYPILKLVYSAVANTSYNMDSNEANLVISNVEVNEGTSTEFQPVLVEGRDICLHPLVCKGFNAYFDGDQMDVRWMMKKENSWLSSPP